MLCLFIPYISSAQPDFAPLTSLRDSTLSVILQQFQRPGVDTTHIVLIGQLNERLRQLRKPQVALPWIEWGLKVAQQAKNPLNIGRMYFQLSKYYHAIYDYPQAIEAIKKAITYSQRSGHIVETSGAMYELARLYEERVASLLQIGQLQKNIAYLQKNHVTNHLIGNYALLYSTHMDIGNLTKAFADLQLMRRIADQSKDPGDCYVAYSNIGEWYEQKGDYTSALPFMQNRCWVPGKRH